MKQRKEKQCGLPIQWMQGGRETGGMEMVSPDRRQPIIQQRGRVFYGFSGFCNWYSRSFRQRVVRPIPKILLAIS